MKVFLAGATGAIGRRLVILLRRAGHDVVGTTRSETKAAALQALGAVPALVDVYDADRLKLAVYAVQSGRDHPSAHRSAAGDRSQDLAGRA